MPGFLEWVRAFMMGGELRAWGVVYGAWVEIG